MFFFSFLFGKTLGSARIKNGNEKKKLGFALLERGKFAVCMCLRYFVRF